MVRSRVGARDDVQGIPMRAGKEPLSTIQYVGTLRIVHFVIPANAFRHPGERRDLEVRHRW